MATTSKSRPRKVTVFNTTAIPRVYNSAGSLIFPATTAQVDPNDPYAKSLLDKGYLIIKEG